MKKKLRFVLDFNVKIDEEIADKDKKKDRRLNLLLKEFLKNDQAILDLYKHFLLGDLQSDEHIKAIEKSIEIRDEKDIIRLLIDKLPPEVKQDFLGIIDNNEGNHMEDFDKLFVQFSMLEFDKASFIEV
jgi:hypothetical protein